MSVDSLIELGTELVTDAITDVASDVITEAASDLFGDVFLSGLDSADAFLGEQLSGSLLDQAGSFAGSGSFWDTFSPGDIWDNVVGSVTDFFNPNEGLALTQQFAGQTPGTSIGSLLGDAYTTVTDFFNPNAGIGLTQDILGTNSAAGVLNDPYSLTSLAQQGQDLISAAGSNANPFNDLLASVQKLVPPGTFNLGTVLKVAQAVGPQAVNTLFGGGTTGQLAAQVFRTGAGLVSGAVNPQVSGPNAGSQLPVRQGTTVFDNSYGGGSQAEFDAINYSIQQQELGDALAGVNQAQENVDSQQRTYQAAQESLTQASASVEAYDQLLAEPGLSEEEIASLTAQREAAAAQVQEATYQVQVSQQDLESAQGQLYTANAQYQQATETALAQPLSPNQDPSVNTNPATATGTNQVGPFSQQQAVNAAVAALGNNVVQGVNQLIRTAQNVVGNVAGIPSVVAAQLASTLASATGVNPNSDGYAGLVQAFADQLAAQGVSPEVLAALRATQGGVDQALLNQARNVATIRQQTQNPAQSGDWRVRLRLAPQSNYLYNAPAPGILQPLKITDGVIFPYTPRIDTAYRADYDTYALTHSNYRGLFYKSSYADAVNINALFTAQDTSEANYLLAVIHFFRSVTKMFYGQDALRGAPPPLVFLSGLGEYQFNEHPCVVTNFQYNLPDNVDYVRAYSAFPNGTNLLVQRDRFQGTASNPLSYALQRLASVGLTKGALNDRVPPPTLGINNPNYVPTKMDISISLLPVQSRSQVSQQFSLQNFANGNLLKGGFW
jgi:hypothetical protein